jgi:DNA polymerase
VKGRYQRESNEGGGKFNVQNMMRDPMYGVDLRYCFKAPEGHMFYIADYAQIECRLLLWRVKDTIMLDKIRGGMSPYVAFAVSFLGADPNMKKTDRLYLSGKACVLGGGYQAGTDAFQRTAKNLAGLEIDKAEAERLKNIFRENNPRIVGWWKKHQMYLQMSAAAGDPTHEIELASGRVLRYFNPRQNGTTSWGSPQYEAQYAMGDEPEHIYGGLITENEIQATARDVLRDGWVALEKAGLPVLWTIHDEYVILGPEKGQEEYCQEIRKVLASSSPWAEGCPLDVNIAVTEHYEKS